MNCFNHSSEPAVGLCKSCFKALCRDCAVEVENGLACKKANCQARVKLINRILDNNKRVLSAGNVQNRIGGWVSIAIGAIFLAAACLCFAFVNAIIGMFSVLAGVVFLVSGLYRLRPGANFPKVEEAAMQPQPGPPAPPDR